MLAAQQLPSRTQLGYLTVNWELLKLVGHQRSTAETSGLCSSTKSAAHLPTHSIWTGERVVEQVIELVVLKQLIAWFPAGTEMCLQCCWYMILVKAICDEP